MPENRSVIPIKELIINFILIMESLEEKQKHLVIPSLSLLNDLEKGWQQHKQCGNCFDVGWLFCVYAKILHHDNNSVVKWGLLRLMNFDAFAEKDIFLLQSLNNTFLYEKNVDESEPEISLALRNWFVKHHSRDPESIKAIFDFLCELSWGPIPIFYTLNSLYTASDEFTNIAKWGKEQLNSMRSLMENNVKLHPPMLRSMSQVTLIKLISRFYEIQNLTVLSNLLSVFSERDVQEPSCWSALVASVGAIPHGAALDYIRRVCQDIRVNDASEKLSVPVLSSIILLLYEAKVICQSEQCAVSQELRTLFLCLSNIDSRPYVNVPFVVKILDLVHHLLNSQRSVPEFVPQFFVHSKERIFRFVLKSLSSQNFSHEECQVCLRALRSVTYRSEGKVNRSEVVTDSNKAELEEKCIQVLNNANKHSELQLLLALQLWSEHSGLFRYENQFFLKVLTELLQIPKSKNRSSELTGKTGQDYYAGLSKLVENHVLTLNTAELSKPADWLDLMSSVLDASGNQLLPHFGLVMHRYSTAIRADSDKLDDFKFLVKSFWNCNFGRKRDQVFWRACQGLAECVNSSSFLNCKPLQELSEEFTSRMLNEGDALPGLKYVLLTCSEVSRNFGHFTEALLSGLLHGQVLRRDQRIGMQTRMRGRGLVSSYEPKGRFEAHDFLNRHCNVDTAIRAAAVLQLCKAVRESADNASSLLPLLLEKLAAVRRKRYFADSQLHRLKHRIYQTLLLLQPHLNQESTTILYNTLCSSLVEDTDQHSVRLMKEWLLIRVYSSNESLLPNLWTFFDKVFNERPGSVSSVIGIIWHVAHRVSKEKLPEFIRTALLKLGTCGMGQQFGMRLFGQVFFAKLYELLDKDCDIRLEYSSFYQAVLGSLDSGNFKKNPVKIDEDFFYTVFNPFEHYSLETIYHQLPRLSNVSFEEWITKENFEEQMRLDNSKVEISVANPDTLLDKSDIPYSILKSNEHSKSEEIECSKSITDIQKKITPWKTILPNVEELQEMASLSSLNRDTRCKQDIIVIASLVDKPQNLGGIARTCEIFGVKELVISNCNQIEEKDFQALSVSADKWLKIKEVKSFLLDKYLLELKNSGWTLIGAEQTANSVNLFDFKFPNKIALVLGNEKNGVPANIIPLLDTCIEIPQFGIIRSLNVHVTSAICIWEYVKQHQFVT